MTGSLRKSLPLFALLLSEGCVIEQLADEPEAADAAVEIGRWNRKVADLSFEEFRDQTYKEPFAGGKYIVDGDLGLDEEGLYSYYQAYLNQDSADALTVSRVRSGTFDVDDIWASPAQFRLTYCVSTSFGARYQLVVDELAEAARSWSQRLNVSFEHVTSQDGSCNASNSNVVFDTRPVDESYFARAFFPSDGRSARNLLISDSAFDTTSGGRDLQGILRHELGHTLGFRHEHIWLDPECTSEPSTGARLVTSYDEGSVMHYPQCRSPEGGGYRQTELDYEGGIALYGLAASLVDVVNAVL